MKIVLVSVLAFITVFHPLHVSVTEIVFDTKEKELEIISRIFSDDLEKAIRLSKKQPELNLLEPGSGITTDQLIAEYLQARFKVTLNGKPQKWKYLGHEVEGDAVLSYIQVEGVKKTEVIEVYNGVLTEVYNDQSNLVHVTVGETIRSLRLTPDNLSGKLTFEKK
jgi:hypothetical protein